MEDKQAQIIYKIFMGILCGLHIVTISKGIISIQSKPMDSVIIFLFVVIPLEIIFYQTTKACYSKKLISAILYGTILVDTEPRFFKNGHNIKIGDEVYLPKSIYKKQLCDYEHKFTVKEIISPEEAILCKKEFGKYKTTVSSSLVHILKRPKQIA